MSLTGAQDYRQSAPASQAIVDRIDREIECNLAAGGVSVDRMKLVGTCAILMRRYVTCIRLAIG